jgi:perosamine synthetase
MDFNYHFSHARTALKYGLKHLGIKPNDNILLPDYICDVLLHPLNQLGIKYKYYPINDDLNPNWDELENIVDEETKALLMVHYFGQPQHIEKFINFCKKHKLLLIEDNAHGHGGSYNGIRLGLFGDCGISSPSKTLRTKSGGILCLKDSKSFKQPQLTPYHVSYRNRINKTIKTPYSVLKNIFNKIVKTRPKYEDPKAFRESPILDYCMDPLSKKTIEETDWIELRRSRQEVYWKWHCFALENNLTPVYSKLYPDANPWCYAAYTKNQPESIKWFEWGWENNKHVFPWPSLPEEVVSDNGLALDRWSRMVCFSTHDIP